MINRREMLLGGVAATVLVQPAAAGAAGGSSAGSHGLVFLADDRIPESGSAARAARVFGAEIQSLQADITAAYEWLDRRLAAAPVAVAGLSVPQLLFPLERLAWDRGLRTVYRGIHRRTNRGVESLELAGSPVVSARVRAGQGRDWGGSLGAVLARSAAHAAAGSTVTTQRIPQPQDLRDSLLVSWLLVPKGLMAPSGSVGVARVGAPV